MNKVTQNGKNSDKSQAENGSQNGNKNGNITEEDEPKETTETEEQSEAPETEKMDDSANGSVEAIKVSSRVCELVIFNNLILTIVYC